MTDATAEAPRREPHYYADIWEAPEAWRDFMGVRWTVEMLNRWIGLAHEHQYLEGGVWVPDYGKAKELFRAEHEIDPATQQWVKKPAAEIASGDRYLGMETEGRGFPLPDSPSPIKQRGREGLGEPEGGDR